MLTRISGMSIAFVGKIVGRAGPLYVENRYMLPVQDAKNDCSVLSTTGNRKYSVPFTGRMDVGIGWYCVVVMRSCRRAQERLQTHQQLASYISQDLLTRMHICRRHISQAVLSLPQ